MKLLAGIVTYNPDIKKLEKNLQAIIKQVDLVLIVDNGSENFKEIKSLSENYENEILLLEKNFGIAYALNEILKKAIQEKCEWFLTLDQDSVSSQTLIADYIEEINSKDKIRIGAMTCVISNPNLPVNSMQRTIDSPESIEVEECITSGCFCNTNAFNSIKGFDNSLFIDCVDNDVCLNLKKNNYKIIQILKNVNLTHEMGEAKLKHILGKKILTYNEKPFRHYYISRNWILLSRKYNCCFIGRILRIWIKSLLFEPNKIKMSKATFFGIFDGICNKSGKLDRRI